MMTFAKFEKSFPNEDACLAYLVKMRWPTGVECPRCANPKVYELAKPYRWQCKKCAKNGYLFSPIAGTIFENTNIKLKMWFQVVMILTQSKKGISALQIHRMLGTGSYRTAWYMCHRIRAAMKDDSIERLTGEVEVDETYIGGRAQAKHLRDKPSKKAIVIGAIARKGNVVCKVIERTTKAKMEEFVEQTVSDRVSILATDEHPGYADLRKKGYRHSSVNHTQKQYVTTTVHGSVHTASLDSFWSLLKRGIVGTFHKVSEDYLPLYLNEFSFRHNHRNSDDMFGAVIAGC